MSSIVTFYSYKGGVGRTMAVANIAILLAQLGLRTLVVDWDLEAPGIERYFRNWQTKRDGLLTLLTEAASTVNQESKPNWRDYVSIIDKGYKCPLSVITSGYSATKNYAQKILSFDWNSFFQNANGGEYIESLRNDWLEEFDVTLIDSRTGITDSGGICTIQLPDILTLVFTTNEQSLQGAKDIAFKAQAARQKLAYDRMPLLVFPLPSRFDGRTQYKEARAWLKKFAKELDPFYQDWLPKDLTSLNIIEQTKLPYIPYFSFGEKLPVEIESPSDPESLGHAYNVAATLIGSDFHEDIVISLFIEYELNNILKKIEKELDFLNLMNE